MPAGLLRYWHTVRHLKPVQIYGRLLFRMRRPRPDLRPAPPRRSFTGIWVPSAPKPACMLGPTRFRFLSWTGELLAARDWNSADAPKLWLYNLHYFDDLSAGDAANRTAWHGALITRWIDENPPTAGNGWEPYPTSLRIVNWVKWALGGHALPAGFEQSLAVQARWLSRRIEYHLQANHLFVNAKALVMAGAWFSGTEASGWLRTGLRILSRELPAQFHADGGHIEGSPMYHALLLEDLFDLLNIAAAVPGVVPAAAIAEWRAAVARMHGWLLAMSHPDGEIAFFNDTAIGIAPSPAALGAYATRVLVPVPTDPSALGASGYVRATRGDAVLIADLAPIGADYQPAHAHADTLSFEFSIGGQRVVVNSGTSTYDVGPERRFERSTAAHSTVEIDGADSSEVWGGFRVARRARLRDVAIGREGDDAMIRGAHDGYCRLPGRAIHERTWRLSHQQLIASDRITGGFTRAVARYYLHPAVTPLDDGRLLLPDGRECRWEVSGGTATVRPTRWFPAFGQAVANHCLEVEFTARELRMVLSW